MLQRLAPPQEPVLAIIVMRARLLVGDREQGCALAGEAIRNRAAVPASFRRDAVLAAGYCAMVGGNAEAKKLTADLIRGEKIDAPFALAVLEGAGVGDKAGPALAKEVRALDYRIGEAAGIVWPSDLVERADPGLLAVLATVPTLDPGLRVVAAERAARLNMLSPEALAEQYRAIPHAPDDLAQPLATRQTGALRRSLLARAAEEARTPDKKTLALRALLDEARQADLSAAIARMVAPMVANCRRCRRSLGSRKARSRFWCGPVAATRHALGSRRDAAISMLGAYSRRLPTVTPPPPGAWRCRRSSGWRWRGVSRRRCCIVW